MNFCTHLKRNAKEYGYSIGRLLHDYEKFGYTNNERLVGSKTIGTSDYLQRILLNDSTGSTYGLDSEIYALKPVHESDFEHIQLKLILSLNDENII